MDFLSGDPRSVVSPREMVIAFRSPGATLEELSLERLAFIAFTAQDLQKFVEGSQAIPIPAWKNRPYRVYRAKGQGQGQGWGKGWVAVRSPFGAPGAVMLLEELAAFGVQRAVFLGYCGALHKGINIGDTILPEEAIREEGTSYHYLPKGEKSLPDPRLQGQLTDWIKDAGLPFFSGKIWTTDAPYRETHEKVRRYCSQGVLGVDMEMAAVFAVGRTRGVSVGAVLIVSDEVKAREWRNGFLSSAVRSSRERVIGTLQGHLGEMVSF